MGCKKKWFVVLSTVTGLLGRGTYQEQLKSSRN